MSWFEWLSPLMIVRLIAAVGGFVVGYMLSGPLWRVIWRVGTGKAVPPGGLPSLKISTGLVLGALLYTLVGFGGGGGWGFGGGGGFGLGKGTGSGTGTGVGDPKQSTDGKSSSTSTQKKSPQREMIQIEMLGGDRYPGDGKFYLIGRKQPPSTLAEVEAAFKARADRLEAHIIYTPTSVGQRTGPADRIRELANKYQVPLVETVEEK